MPKHGYALWSALLLALAGCGTMTDPGAPSATPTSLPPGPRLVLAPEGSRATPPARWQQAAASFTVSGHLVASRTAPSRMLYTYSVADTPPGQPSFSYLILDDPAGRLPADPDPALLITVTGAYAPNPNQGGARGTLTVETMTVVPLDQAAWTAASDAAIRAAASRLVPLDYSTLALPLYHTATAAWKPQAQDFGGGGSQFLGLAEDGTAITRWHGPPLPAHPDRPTVTRWPAVYAYFSGPTVTTLLVTIDGQVEE